MDSENSDSIILTYSQLFALGFPEELSLKAAQTHPNNISSAIDWIKSNKTNDIDTKKDKQPVHEDCTSIDQCKRIKNLIDALKYYQSLDIKDNDTNQHDNLIAFCTQKNTCLIDDYTHIILQHNDDMELIYDLIQTNYDELLSCNFATCGAYKRSNGNREMNCSEDKSNNVQFIFWRDLLDQMHCFMIHLFHCGLRIKKTDIENKNNDDNKTDKMNSNSDLNSCYDLNFASLTKIVTERRKRSQKMEHNKSDKFTIKLNGHNGKEEKTENKDKDDKRNNYASTAFSIGYTFYYWDYYKNKQSTRQWFNNENDHLGYSPCQLFIIKKYSSLQNELLNNRIHKIILEKYKQIYEKAQTYIKSKSVRSLKAAEDFWTDVHYEIKPGSQMTIEHLMSILFYTDFTDLSTAFSSTFRTIKQNESLSSIKKRNAEYFHLSKLIRETVQSFGEELGWKRCKPFYCGMTMMFLIPQFVIRLCSPTSTSKCLEIAYNFTNENGIIIQMNNGGNYNSRYLRYFNCACISCFPSEDERLFVGGNYPLRVESVRLMKTQQNLHLFFKSLFYFDCILSGIQITRESVKNIKNKDHKILTSLINHVLGIKNNTFLSYINNTFATYCNYKKHIIINLNHINDDFIIFKDILFQNAQFNVLKVELIAELFVQCNHITLYDSSNKISFDILSIIKMIQSTKNNITKMTIKVAKWDNGDAGTWLYSSCNDVNFLSKVHEQKYKMEMVKEKDINNIEWDVLLIDFLQ